MATGLDALAPPDLQIPPPRFKDVMNRRFEIAGFPVNTFLASPDPADFTDEKLPSGCSYPSEVPGIAYARTNKGGGNYRRSDAKLR
ncbi:hypothetical protein DL764_006245 [Monosporascus ibericus]|uniref:Uncharacterized protein n=1 Tax=Monosporascus ibericus TaxID=155417 RepID=A0A4Q4T5A4_9PEZI|nr:hypothetical protein DL764_006245 [Monosporascus ibericus]